jgi:hypothetical protein
MANSSHPWVPMTGAKPPGAGGAPSHNSMGHPSQVITLDHDDRRARYDQMERQHKAAQMPQAAAERYMGTFRASMHLPPGAPGSHQQHPSQTPPPAHGMRPKQSSHLSPGLPKMHQQQRPGDPGPPPPLTPLQAGAGQQQQQQQIPFKPYDFARRNVSPRSHTSAYPTAYSAPPASARPKVTSPLQVNQQHFTKTLTTSAPARPESSPAVSAAPPPAHQSGHRVPSHLPPPPPALSFSSLRQPLPAPTIGSLPAAVQNQIIPPPSTCSSTASNDNDQPLDLGAPTKRKVSEVSEVDSHATPAKTVKLEAGMPLYKVSEPSVLSNPEASNITQVENVAIKKEEPADPQESGSSAPAPPGGYVHKLKKAWIKAYSANDDQPPAKKPATGDYSAPSTPSNSNTRATPSPAPSNTSVNSKKVNGHMKEESGSSSDTSSNSNNAKFKASSAMKTGSKGHRGGRGGGRSSNNGSSRASSRGPSSNVNNDLSDSDDGSKDSDATTSSRKSIVNNKGAAGRRGRKPKRGGGPGRNVGNRTTDQDDSASNT